LNRIVVAEYPKSGGSWLVSMIGNTLSIPKRDIYVKTGFDRFDIREHPWYKDAPSLELTDSCIIKSHEYPDSKLHDFPAQFIHLIRDGRDVVMSKYYYEKEFCVKNGIRASFDIPLDKYIENVAAEWARYELAWLDADVVECRYEELLEDAFSTLKSLLERLRIQATAEAINNGIQTNTREKMRDSFKRTFKHNTFVRKGIAGDWKNNFAQKHKEIFKSVAGEVLIMLRYEEDMSW